uniref:Uncharacterized protein n=1 Tax=Globodera rostochiensis TaxID=31243 RepID=A0A914HFT1_GLORO
MLRQLIRQCHFSSIPSAALIGFGTLFLLIWWLSMGFSSGNNLLIVNQTFTIKPSNLIVSPTDAKVSLQSKNEHLAAAFGSLWPKLSQLNCNSLLTNGMKFKQFSGGKWRRILQKDPPHGHLDTNCTAIRARWHFVETAGTAREANFPLAFARTVFRPWYKIFIIIFIPSKKCHPQIVHDFLLLEQMLSVEYTPQNVYCYALDAKADALFMRRVHALARCFPNVVVLAEQFSVFSNGKNVTRAQLACLEAMLPMGKWKYALLLQNHDLPLRTNAELVEILRVYKGTNDIGTKKIVPNTVNLSLDWSLASLHIYREGHRVPMPTNLTRLHHTKSLNLIALSRSAVEFTLGTLRLDKMIAQLELSAYGMDEVLFSTLNSNLPDFPGGFSPICLPRRPVPNMGRYTIWHGNGVATASGGCRSAFFRHGVCVYGTEDLWHIARDRLHFYLNKMMPSFDFGAIFCWLNALTARRDGQRRTKKNAVPLLKVNRRFYAELPHVRYNRLRCSGRLAAFNC